jgi:hypothetical protein
LIRSGAKVRASVERFYENAMKRAQRRPPALHALANLDDLVGDEAVRFARRSKLLTQYMREGASMNDEHAVRLAGAS